MLNRNKILILISALNYREYDHLIYKLKCELPREKLDCFEIKYIHSDRDLKGRNNAFYFSTGGEFHRHDYKELKYVLDCQLACKRVTEIKIWNDLIKFIETSKMPYSAL